MRTYGRKSWDIVGYNYRAEIWCPNCTIHALIGEGILSPGARGMDCEEALQQAAEYVGIEDRMDERTFDSRDFPKVIFDSHLDGTELCCVCGEEL